MSVILTVTDSQTEEVPDIETALQLNGVQDQEEEEEEDEDNAREAELVVFDGTTQGLGLKICGGSSEDGTQEQGIFIKRVLPGGLADSQGGLQEGDLILDVNGENMEGVSYDRALSILRQASSSDHVEMVVARDDEARESFQDLISGIALAASNRMSQEKQELYPLKPSVNRDHVINTDPQEEFPFHMEDFYKQTAGLRSDRPNSEHGPGGKTVEDGSPEELSGSDCHPSPASSCHSQEVASHFPPLASPRQQHQGAKMSSSVLDSVLNHSFPLAVNSVGPSCRLPVSKLEKTLESLGFVISAQKHIELLKNISLDSQGLTSFDDFVRAVREVFHGELQTRTNSQRSTPLPSCDSPAPLSPSQVNGHYSGDSFLQQENDQLRQKIESLKDDLKDQRLLCQRAEEQLLTLRKESQIAIEESRSLRTKLHLAEQSQEAARKMEQDYEQVVAMLENEISQLRLHLAKSDVVMDHRRLAVTVCQLKKAETGKKTLEVAANKLLSHVQHVQDVLSAESSASRWGGDSDRKKKKQTTAQSLLTEVKDVIRTTQTLLEQVPLPFGWEENYTADGVRYYINHLNQTTSWNHPLSSMEHQSINQPTAGGAGRRPPPPPPSHSPPPAVEMTEKKGVKTADT